MGGEVDRRFQTFEDLMFDKDIAKTAATDIFNIGIFEQRLENAQPQLVAHRAVFEGMQLARRDGDFAKFRVMAVTAFTLGRWFRALWLAVARGQQRLKLRNGTDLFNGIEQHLLAICFGGPANRIGHLQQFGLDLGNEAIQIDHQQRLNRNIVIAGTFRVGVDVDKDIINLRRVDHIADLELAHRARKFMGVGREANFLDWQCL